MTTLFIVIRFYSIYIYWVVYSRFSFCNVKTDTVLSIYYNIISNILLPYKSIFVGFLEFLNKILSVNCDGICFFFRGPQPCDGG